MESADNGRSLVDYPSVVVAYFEKPEVLQAALAELRGLGLQTGDVHIVTAPPTAAVAEPQPTRGLFQRLRSLLGQSAPPTAPARGVAATPGQSVAVIQASRLPGVPIVQILERHGASKVETREAVHTATKHAND